MSAKGLVGLSELVSPGETRSGWGRIQNDGLCGRCHTRTELGRLLKVALDTDSLSLGLGPTPSYRSLIDVVLMSFVCFGFVFLLMF